MKDCPSVLLSRHGRRICFVYWTRWPHSPGIARAVIGACIQFTSRACGEGAQVRILLIKTPGREARTPDLLAQEEAEWREASDEAKGRCAELQFEFEFIYLPGNPPVTTAWHVCWSMSRFWESADILAFPAMDFIDAMLDPPHQLTPLATLQDDVRKSVLDAPVHFAEMLNLANDTHGLAVGGYDTIETQQSPQLCQRRGNQPAKDLVENAIRCYASGMFGHHEAFQRLLDAIPRLRVRSEILVFHRDFWLALMAHDMLRLEPWEATIQLVLAALDTGCAVDQVEFGWLVEEGGKPDRVIAEQLRRGIHCIDRLAAAYNALPKPSPAALMP
jgi:hypothetical protein